MEEIFNQIKIVIEDNPQYVSLAIGLLFLFFAIGNFTNKDWAIDPANSTQKFNYEIFGHNAFRFGKGIIYLLGFIAGLYGFIYGF